MQFAEIPEHYTFKKNLLRAGNTGRVAHAQLFIGSVGSANLALALAFATYLNCTSRSADDACGSCLSCASMAQLTHPDLQLVFPKKSSSALEKNQTEAKYIDEFRNCLKGNPFLTLEEWTGLIGDGHKQCKISKKDTHKIIQQLSLKAFVGQYKIVLIWLPEYLHNVAANALLKTLEEPPPHTVFLLVSCSSEKILSTIRSRSQQHHIPPFSEEAIQQILHHKYNELDVNQSRAIAFLAEGDVYKAFQLAEQTVTENFERFSNWMRSCYSSNFIKLITQSETFQKLSIDAQRVFFTYALQLIRVTLLHKLTHCLPLATLTTAEVTFSKKFCLQVTVAQLKKMIALLTPSCYYLERNANAKLVYINASIQIAKIFKPFEKSFT